MLDEMETMIHALAGVGNDIAHDLRTPLTRARLTLERGRTNAATLEQLQAVADKAIAGIDQSLAIITRAIASCGDRKQPAVGGIRHCRAGRDAARGLRYLRADRRKQEYRPACRSDATSHVRGDRDLLIEAGRQPGRQRHQVHA